MSAQILEFPQEADARNWHLSCGEPCGGTEFRAYKNGDLVCVECHKVSDAARVQELLFNTEGEEA